MLIDNPMQLSFYRRIIDKIIPAAATLALWYFSGQHFYWHLFSPGYSGPTARMILLLSLIAVITFCLMLGWAKYNLIIFGRQNRRKERPPVTSGEIAAFYNINTEQVLSYQNTKYAVLKIDNTKISIDKLSSPASYNDKDSG